VTKPNRKPVALVDARCLVLVGSDGGLDVQRRRRRRNPEEIVGIG